MSRHLTKSEVLASIKPARVARSLSAILVISLIQTIGGSILIPSIVNPSANAAVACVLGVDYTRDTASVPGFTILKFTKTGSCSFRNTTAITAIDYLIVGGGGGGGAHVGGGGGGGGVLQATNYNVSNLGAIPITVGSGGTGAWVTSAWQGYGSDGASSSLDGITAFGGGKGGSWNTYAPGYLNGSVGSAGGSGSTSNYGGGTPGQGNAGGLGNNTQPHAAGGGGGAGTAGGNGSQTDNANGTGGRGGDGIQVTITGTATYFGGGGGGGVHGNNNYSYYTGGAGGLGGGGAGATHEGNYSSNPRPAGHSATSGSVNTGGGGGGDGAGLYYVENRGGNGGSGIVIIRYANSSVAAGSQDVAMTTNDTKYMYTTNSSTIIPGTVSTMTLEAWIKPSATCYGTYHCMIFSVENSYLFHVYAGKIAYHIGSGSALCDGSNGKYPTTTAIPSGSWSHVALVRNGSNVKIYIDGQLRSDINSSCTPSTQTANSNYFYVGGRPGSSQNFYGSIDEARVWSTDRSSSISSDMHSNETSTSGLLNYWNFNEGSGLIAYNQVPTAPSENDLVVTSSATWDVTTNSVTTVSGAYTTQTFYKSYITAAGGWRAPTGIATVSAVVVGGGGGGNGETDGTGWMSGGGGAGGYQYFTSAVTSTTNYSIIVGQGGRLGTSVNQQSANEQPTNGQNSTFLGRTSVGGGAGGGRVFTNDPPDPGKNGGSGGGGGTYNSNGGSGTVGQGSDGGKAFANCCSAGGGGGAGSPGGGGASGLGGSAGDGVLNPLYIATFSAQYLAAGGAGGSHNGTPGTVGTKGGVAYKASASANSGSGGGGGGGGNTEGFDGGYGGSGIVIIRWITATKPIFTPPTNAFLNVGMTETFTTNVVQDSATVTLTRTFRWESSTAGINGPYSVIKQGTGAANAFFSWVPQDTRTSGSTFAYRVIVTDSDAAGLFIVDTSTAVWAVINPALRVSGSSTITKRINLSKNETFTITLGTSTYRSTLSPVIPGITLDTSTAGIAVIRIADTVTVGTYYETLTVIDSVSASVVTPLIIQVAAPPNLLYTGEIISDNLVFNLDAGNSASLIADSGTATTGITWNDLSGSKANAATGAGVNTGALSTTTCTAPTYSSANGGALQFSANSDNCYYASSFTGRSLVNSYTIEAWFKTTSVLANGTSIVTQSFSGSNVPINIFISANPSGALIVGFYDQTNTADRFANCPYNPVVGAWTHIVGTYDGTTLTTYINGSSNVSGSGSCTSTQSYTPSGSANPLGMLIGKGRTGASATAFPGSISTIRMYNKSLTAAQILANFNATKSRFDSSNNDLITPTKKYGTTLLDSFTATSGLDTKTVTFSVGDRAGIDWETITATNRVNLTMQESLTVGTFVDTATVTDSLGQSTYLPIRMTVTKADSLTVTMSAATTVTYNGTAITVYPRATVTGLKWTDTATSLSRFSSSLYTESTVIPTNADTYTVRGNTPSFTLGSIDNYLGVIYETTTARINQAKQRPLNIYMYGGFVGLPYPISLQGGDGTGAVTETLTGVSTLTGCAISNRILTAAEQKQGFCEVKVVKAGDQNYFAETQTVQLYFMAYVNNQPTGQVGSGSTIGLNGKTSLTIDDSATVRVPRISSYSKSGSTLTINGEGFGSIPVTITFERYVDAVSSPTPSLGGTVITVAIPGTAISGPVLVITVGGRDSIEWLDLP